MAVFSDSRRARGAHPFQIQGGATVDRRSLVTGAISGALALGSIATLPNLAQAAPGARLSADARDQWQAALDRLDQARADWRKANDRVEEANFGSRECGDWERDADERMDAYCAAIAAVLSCPAPSIREVEEKIELAFAEQIEIYDLKPVLADLRRLAEER